jgi:ABC-type Fe3+-hydroxamate transport system substrate-binding protein
MIQPCFRFIRLFCTILGYAASGLLLASPTAEPPEAPVPTVIALSPHITEILYDLGLQAHILAVAEGSNYPEDAQRLPTIRAHGNLSLESIVKHQPDWVIAWPYGQAKTLKQRLKPFAIKVLFSDPTNFEQLGQDYLAIAALFPNKPQVQTRAKARNLWIQQQLKRLNKAYKVSQNAAPVSVFIYLSGSPLRTLNNQHPIVNLIENCGGYNVFGQASAPAPLVSLEAVIQKSPQLIILSNKGQQGLKPLQLWHDRFDVPAVQHGHLVEIHPDFLHRPSLRALKAADVLCQAIADSRRTPGAG